MLRRHRRDRCRGRRPNRQLLSQPPLLGPAPRSRARASRFRRPLVARRRLLRASRFRRPPAEAGGVRRRAPEEVLEAQCDHQLAPRGQGPVHQDGLLRLLLPEVLLVRSVRPPVERELQAAEVGADPSVLNRGGARVGGVGGWLKTFSQ